MAAAYDSKQMNMPELKLKQDVSTRWNSTLDMIKRFIKIKMQLFQPWLRFKAESNSLAAQSIDSLSSNEWDLLTQLENIFQIFEDITKEISAEQCVTISKMLI